MEQLRNRINAWFEKHEVPWELFMAVMAIAYVVMAIAYVVMAFIPGHPLLRTIDIGLSIFFVSEFTVRFTASRSRSHYILHHWMDLVALLPAIPAYQDAALARLLRLLRLLMILRLLGALDRITHHVKGVTAQPGLTYLLGAIIFLVLSVSGINYFLERNVNEGLGSYSNTIYWALVTVTTTGYGDIAPKTPLGRAMAVVLMIGGLILWSLLTASMINYLSEFMKTRHVQANPAVEDVKGKLDRLDALSPDELASLKGAIVALIEGRQQHRQPAPGPAHGPGEHASG